MNLSPFDWSILAAYLIFLLFIAFRISKEKSRGDESYLLDGRRLTLPSFVATTVSTWYGGILGVGEYSYKHGLSNWLVFGVPYYLAALIFALFIAERARKSRMMSIPDQLNKAYGGKMAVGGSIFVFIMTVPAVYVLMLGVLINLLLGWSLTTGVIIATLISSGYVLIGGFRSVVRTDWLQFSLMFLAFFLIVGKLFSSYGGLAYLQASLPASHFDWRGGATAGYVFSWYFIAMSALIEPAFYQRSFAAKTPKIAKKGLLVSILFWMLFDFMTTSTGMFARAILGEGIKGVNAFPLLADIVLPAGIKGLFVVGLMTTIMSTIDSYSFLAASTLGRDVLWRVKAIKSRISQVGITRWGLAASGISAICIALMTESVVDIWHRLGSLGTPALLLPMALSYNDRWKYRPGWAMANLILAPSVVGLWFIVDPTIETPGFGWLTQPIFSGLVVSVGLLVADHLTRNEKKIPM